MAKIATVHIPAELKNMAINGALDFWQDKVGATTTVNTATTQSPLYSADMFKVRSFGSTVKNYNYLRSTAVLPSLAQSGFQSTYSYQFQVLTAIPSGATNDLVFPIEYVMEGFDYEKIHSKTVTFGFWFFASVVGTYSFALGNAAGNRTYVTTFTVNGASTWEYKTITVTLDNTGTWAFDNSAGLEVYIGVFAGAGSGSATSLLNTWQGGNFVAASTATNYFATVNAVINFAQFSIVEGSLGLGDKGFIRAGKDIQAELAMCERYLQQLGKSPDQAGNSFASGFAATTTNGLFNLKFTTPMRTIPSLVIVNNSDWAIQRNTGATINATSVGFNNTGTTSGRLGVNVAAGLTAGEGILFLSNNQNGLLLDARV